MRQASWFTQQSLWKVATVFFAGAFAFVVSRGAVADADAAGPKNLSRALSSLHATKKYLEEAKEPPAPYHAQSTAVVDQAISAVEREIKAFEQARERKNADKDKKSDGKKSEGGSGSTTSKKSSSKHSDSSSSDDDRG